MVEIMLFCAGISPITVEVLATGMSTMNHIETDQLHCRNPACFAGRWSESFRNRS